MILTETKKLNQKYKMTVKFSPIRTVSIKKLNYAHSKVNLNLRTLEHHQIFCTYHFYVCNLLKQFLQVK